jgi:UDP:flavonoid glycosyltransferase YjiC (YdhE family)
LPGKRIFAYLKPFPTLPTLLSLLNELKTPTLAYIPGLDRKIREKYASPALRFVDRPLNMERVASECDLGILNGTHTTTANLLMAGKPTLHFPLYLEQQLTAQKVENVRAGGCVHAAGRENIRTNLGLVLNQEFYAECAKVFRAQWASEDSRIKTQRLISFIESRCLESVEDARRNDEQMTLIANSWKQG